MKKFVMSLVLLCTLSLLVLLGIIGVIQMLPPQFTDTYDAAILDKYERLMTTKSPKIIMAAGSNFAFGIDSPTIEKEFDMPVVNLGLHAGNKPHFTLEIAKKNINKGDVIIVGFEYGEYYGRTVDVQTVLTTVENYPVLWSCLDYKDFPRLLKGYISDYGMIKVDRYLNGYPPLDMVYERKNFNECGDIVYEKEGNIRGDYEPEVDIEKEQIAASVIKELNQFYKFATDKGATVYLTYPSCDIDAVRSSKKEINEFAQALEEELDIPIISDIHDYMLISQLFYDTDYHLNNEGTYVRTGLLIEDMKKVIKK